MKKLQYSGETREFPDLVLVVETNSTVEVDDTTAALLLNSPLWAEAKTSKGDVNK